MAEPNMRINEVHTELEITEGIGSLSPEEVRKLVSLVLEQVQMDQERAKRRESDTRIGDRVFHPDSR